MTGLTSHNPKSINDGPYPRLLHEWHSTIQAGRRYRSVLTSAANVVVEVMGPTDAMGSPSWYELLASSDDLALAMVAFIKLLAQRDANATRAVVGKALYS